MITIRELRQQSKMSRADFSRLLNIPIRTLENWESEKKGKRQPPSYLIELIEYKLKKENII